MEVKEDDKEDQEKEEYGEVEDEEEEEQKEAKEQACNGHDDEGSYRRFWRFFLNGNGQMDGWIYRMSKFERRWYFRTPIGSKYKLISC